MRLLLASFTLLFGVGLLCFAAGPPPKPLRADDQLDYLFLGSDRPVLIRLHIRVGDRPYHAAWDDFMDKLFAWFDENGDGSLSKDEVSRIPTPHHLAASINGGIDQTREVVKIEALDANKDGKVSKEEFIAYYKSNFVGPESYTIQSYRTAIAEQINRSVFARLDANKGGKLTASKVAGMYRKLRASDVDEDEVFTEEELLPADGERISRGFMLSPLKEKTPIRLLVKPDLPRDVPSPAYRDSNWPRLLLETYDRNKDGKLSRAEIGLPLARFEALDGEHKGFLGEAEMRKYLDGEPDIVLRIQMRPGVTKPAAPPVEMANEKALPRSLRKAVRRPGPRALSFELGDARLSVQTLDAEAKYDMKKGFLEQFDQAVGKRESLPLADADPTGLVFMFRHADRNGDGKLTRRELSEYMDILRRGTHAGLTVRMHDLGKGIFTVLDADGDGRLTSREMKDAWSRLKPFDKDGRGVAPADLPRTLRLTLELGSNPWFGGGMRETPPPLAPRTATKAPVWFRKMDRNNDGDVSRKEWLGTDADFEAIDADGDGLISVAEAIAFEAKKRKKDQP